MDERKLAILRAIVTDYVSSREPVGSKALVERHNLQVSPATVRNDMAVLEEEGYITQPHTSAGRIPTDKGYRLFVDRIAQVKPLSAAEKRAIETFMAGALDLDDVVRRTVRLLAQVTRQVAIVQYPVLSSATIRHVEVVQLSAERSLVLVVNSSGRIEQRPADLPDAPENALADLRGRLNDALGITSIVVSHDVQEVGSIADYSYLLAGGRVVARGTTAELNASVDPSVRQFMQGSSDGPVSFHYPAQDYLQSMLDGADVAVRK